MRLFLVLAFAAVACAAAEVQYQPAVPPAFMPDGQPFLTWRDLTHYTRTYHVSQNNPQASDQNDGSGQHPFLTIGHAAQVAKAGERVCIHSGIYRELVRPRFAGEGQDKMIAYEAAPGEQVVLRGSRVITNNWTYSIDPHDPTNIARGTNEFVKPGFRGFQYSRQLWMVTLPDSMFENGYFPFKLPNASDKEIDLMDWALRWKGRLPYTLPRGLLFQEGRRLEQLSAYEDIVRLPGSYWVAPDGRTVHIHPCGNVDPNSQLFEAAVQEHIIQPQTQGLGFIRINGLILEHCANGFLRSGVGALFTMGGHHWIIESNTVRHANSVGIEPGDQPYERHDPRLVRRTNAESGYNILRHNCVSDCGTAGIRGLAVTNALVEGNDITGCGWQDAEYHWEVAGIKLLRNQGTLVRNNHISHLQGSCGIWLDWGNQNSRISGNVIHDIVTVQGAIFIEASQSTNLVDNNVIWNINGEGVRLADTDNAVVAHNLFGHVSAELVAAKVATDRSLNGRKLTSARNRIVNNIIVDNGKPILATNFSNVLDNNVYVIAQPGQPAVTNAGERAMVIAGNLDFDADRLLLTWKSPSPLPTVPFLKDFQWDYFQCERAPDRTFPGPFQALAVPAILQLPR